jgi:hypothetical protein
MLYMILLYWDEANPVDGETIIGEHMKFAEQARAGGAYVLSESLGGIANATTVKVRDGDAIITDGPFIESKETMGGFYLLDCADLDEALEYAKNIPDAKHTAVEVRPVLHVPGWDYGPDDRHHRHPMG